MINVNINTCVDGVEAVTKASEKLGSILKDIKEKGLPVLLLMSGGSALKIANNIDKDCLPSNLTLGVLDDRYSQDPEVNNFSQLSRTRLYSDALSLNANFIDTLPKGDENIDQVASRADQGIKNWQDKNINGKVIITQGVGPDGHTSGVMPFPEDEEKFQKLFIETDRYSVGYDAAGKNQYSLRITATLSFLINKVDESVLLMTGEDKKEAFEKAFEIGSLAQVPARVIQQMKSVHIFTDIK